MAVTHSNERTVEFYLSSLWSWLPEGRKRILDTLQNCSVQAYFTWDAKYDWFHIRCLEDDKDYIMKEYLKSQSEMEVDLRKRDVIEDNENLIPNVENDLMNTPPPRVAIPSASGGPVADRTEYFGTQCPNGGQGYFEETKESDAESETPVYPF